MSSRSILPDVEFIDLGLNRGYLTDDQNRRLPFEVAVQQYGIDNVLLSLHWEATKEAYASGKRSLPATVFISFRHSSQTETAVRRIANKLRARRYVVDVDFDNPLEHPTSIPRFVAGISSVETILIVHDAGYLAGQGRTWIHEERRAALIAGLTGSADLVVFRLDDSPMSEPWLSFFPNALVGHYDAENRALDEHFPDRTNAPAIATHIYDDVAQVLARAESQPVDKAVVERLKSVKIDELPNRVAQDLALARALLKVSLASDKSHIKARSDRTEGRRIRIAEHVERAGFPGDAIRFLQPHFRRSNRRREAHSVVGEILERRFDLRLAARNHYCAASRIAEVDRQLDLAQQHTLDALLASVNCECGWLVAIDLQVAASRFGTEAALLAAIEMRAPKYGPIKRMLQGQHRLPDTVCWTRVATFWVICSSCFAAFEITSMTDRACACCSHTITPSASDFAREQGTLENGAHQMRVQQLPTGELRTVELKNSAVTCCFCSYPGLVPWRMMAASDRNAEPIVLSCALCASGQLSVHDATKFLKVQFTQVGDSAR